MNTGRHCMTRNDKQEKYLGKSLLKLHVHGKQCKKNIPISGKPLCKFTRPFHCEKKPGNPGKIPVFIPG